MDPLILVVVSDLPGIGLPQFNQLILERIVICKMWERRFKIASRLTQYDTEVYMEPLIQIWQSHVAILRLMEAVYSIYVPSYVTSYRMTFFED